MHVTSFGHAAKPFPRDGLDKNGLINHFSGIVANHFEWVFTIFYMNQVSHFLSLEISWWKNKCGISFFFTIFYRDREKPSRYIIIKDFYNNIFWIIHFHKIRAFDFKGYLWFGKILVRFGKISKICYKY